MKEYEDNVNDQDVSEDSGTDVPCSGPDAQDIEKTEKLLADARVIMDDISSQKKKFALGLVLGLVISAVICAVVFGIVYRRAVDSQEAESTAVSEETQTEGLIDDTVISKISSLVATLDAYYLEDIDQDALVEGIYKGLVDAVGDKYTTYYTAEEMEVKEEKDSGEYSGIGATLSKDPDTENVVIIRIAEDSPSEESGLQVGDIIVSADEYIGAEMDLDDFVSHVRGEDGTEVHLVVERDGEQFELDVERANIDLTVVDGFVINGDIGYIGIGTFNQKTAEQFEQTYEELEAEGISSLIIDLRANGGGLVDAAVEVCDYILPEATIVYTEDKNGDREYITSDDEESIDLPIVLLVDENTASSSEIMAGALRDNDAATLVGQTTYGKGIVQWVFRLTDGSGLKLTAQQYFTPDGDMIHDVGITPDYEVEYEQVDPGVDDITDSQALKAIEILRKAVDED